MNFKMKPETEEALRRRELVAELVERRYGPFQGAGGSGRVLFEGALRDLPLAQLQRMAEGARAYEVAQKQKRNGREKHL